MFLQDRECIFGVVHLFNSQFLFFPHYGITTSRNVSPVRHQHINNKCTKKRQLQPCRSRNSTPKDCKQCKRRDHRKHGTATMATPRLETSRQRDIDISNKPHKEKKNRDHVAGATPPAKAANDAHAKARGNIPHPARNYPLLAFFAPRLLSSSSSSSSCPESALSPSPSPPSSSLSRARKCSTINPNLRFWMRSSMSHLRCWASLTGSFRTHSARISSSLARLSRCALVG